MVQRGPCGDRELLASAAGCKGGRFLPSSPLPLHLLVNTCVVLLVCAAILLASKYEEIYAPAVGDLEFVSAKTYSRDEILKMESAILTTLKFQLTVPTPFVFLQRFLCVADADTQLTHLAYFYAERMLQEYGMLKHLPSTIAAAAVSLALRATGRRPWVRCRDRAPVGARDVCMWRGREGCDCGLEPGAQLA